MADQPSEAQLAGPPLNVDISTAAPLAAPPVAPLAVPPVKEAPALPKTSAQVTLHSKNPNTILSRKLLQTYFDTTQYPFTSHHIDSYDQCISQDIPAIIRSNNPILILKEELPNTTPTQYKYKCEIFVGGETGSEFEIGTPTISLQKTREVRVMFPNEARLRNLTYSSTVYANILIRVTLTLPGKPQDEQPAQFERTFPKIPLFSIPVLLHSRFCILHGKPASFLEEAGECPQDQGGYFIVDGSEKVLITRQEQSFNTLYVAKKPNDPEIETYASISCLSPATRQVKMVTFAWNRKTETLQVVLPYVRKEVSVFLLFRALGVQADEDVFRLIYPDLQSSEAKQMIPLLLPSVAEAYPFLDQFSAITFLKSMTKGYTEAHVYDILFNQLFIHIPNATSADRAHFLAECVRKFMRVHVGVDQPTDRDDTRNQRCLTSGLLIRMLFNKAYTMWKKATRLSIDREFYENTSEYQNDKFINIFAPGSIFRLFNLQMITEELNRGFKGKWIVGNRVGDEKTGVLQQLGRMSYLDFMSHCRRVNLNFDTEDSNPGPRQLHTSQYGFFCTNETPGGSSIGITKNLALMTLVSTASDPEPVKRFLLRRGWVIPCTEMRPDLQRLAVPVFLNNGIVGYTLQPRELTRVLKLMKWTACLPALCSIGYSIRNRRVFLFLDEGRPCRPLIHLGAEHKGTFPKEQLDAATRGANGWRNLVLGSFSATKDRNLSSTGFIDPMQEDGAIKIQEYVNLLEPQVGLIEYVDPYEQNEAAVVNFPEHIEPESSHIEIHPCTIVSIVNGMIPFANFNQSPRNQLSCAQSKQGVGMYATNFQNRFDGTANVLCYGESPLIRTLQYDVLGQGMMPYGANVTMAIMPFHGFNRDDGIIFNLDSFQRGLFRSMNMRSYTTYEEIDVLAGRSAATARSVSVIANPMQVSKWTDLKPGLDYSKLDDRGIIRVGQLVDENTVIVGKYIRDKSGKIKDASLTPQVWTSGRVESVAEMIDNQGLLRVKVRVTQDRVPEFGDKFSTRHGQKGTIGMVYRAHDMPRTASGLVPDMIVNPHCIPSRMTVAQLLEILFGKVCYQASLIGDATLFMSDKDAPEAIGRILEAQYGMERGGNEIVYDGESGRQIPTNIFMGPVFAMRLKHMVEDKWNARAEGRKEQKTHQPTGGRGAQGGLRIGEMDRDTIVGHGIADFLKESMMERSDKAQFRICNGCGTIPIFNEEQNLFVCTLCDGPVTNTEMIPSAKRSQATTSLIEMPYATKVLAEEMQTFMNFGMRFLTAKNVMGLKAPPLTQISGDALNDALKMALPERPLPETRVMPYQDVKEETPTDKTTEDLTALGTVTEIREKARADALAEAEADADRAAEQAAGLAEEATTLPDPAFLKQQEEAGFYYDKRAKQFKPDPIIKQNGLQGLRNYVDDLRKTGTGWEETLQERRDAMAAAADSEEASEGGQGGVTINIGGQPQMLQTNPPPSMMAPMSGTSSAVPMFFQQQPNGFMQQPTGFMQQTNGSMQQPTGLMQQGGAQQMMMPNPLMYMPQPPLLLPPPNPGAGQTIVIDTGSRSMQAGGYMEDQQFAARGEPVMGGQSRAPSRRITPRVRREPASFGGANPMQGPPPSGTKFVINKLG